MEGTTSPPTRRAVETLRVLARGPLSHSEIARRVGMSPATTHAVLAELVACGWAHRDTESRRYQLGADFLDWAGSLTRPETRIHQIVQSLAGVLELPVLYGTLDRGHDLGPTLVVRDTSAFIDSPRSPASRSIELPFAAPLGSVIAAHAPEAIRSVWLPADAGLAERFRAKLDDVASAGYSVESYGPHVIQLLTLVRTSTPEFGRERTAIIADDLQRLIAEDDLEQTGRYPALVSVPVRTGTEVPGSLTVQLRHTTDSPHEVLPQLLVAARELESVLLRDAGVGAHA